MKYPEELLESNPLVEPEDYLYEEPNTVASESENAETEDLLNNLTDETQPVYESAFAAKLNENEAENYSLEFENYTPAQKLDKVRDWAYLLGFKVNSTITEALKKRSMSVQYAHNESYSNDLNTDFYGLQISKFPVVNGVTLTPESLIKYIRLNINSLVDTSLCDFNPYSATDAPVWKSDNPTGAVLRLKIFPDNAAVVVSVSTPTGWRFSTVTTPVTGRHPVSGHREFFIGKDKRTGYYYFIVKGLDMFSSGVAGLGAPIAAGIAFRQADKLWKSLIKKITEFINSNRGMAKPGLIYSERVEWRFVYHLYKNILEQTFGKGAGSAEKSSFITFEGEQNGTIGRGNLEAYYAGSENFEQEDETVFSGEDSAELEQLVEQFAPTADPVLFYEDVKVKSGETLIGLATEYGFDHNDWREVWKDPKNAALVTKRKLSTNLREGDILQIPIKWKITSSRLDAAGATFKMTAERSGKEGLRLDWVQTIYGGNQPNFPVKPFPAFSVDLPTEDDLPFYWTQKEYDQLINDFEGKPIIRTRIKDRPNRPTPTAAQGDTTWRAITSLCVITNKRVSIWNTFVWGINFKANGTNDRINIRAATADEINGHLNLLRVKTGKSKKTYTTLGWTFRSKN